MLLASEVSSTALIQGSYRLQEDNDSQLSFAAHWTRAQEFFERAEYRAALREYRQVVKMIGEEPSSRLQIARCLVNLGDYDDATNAIRQAIECGFDDEQRLRESPEFERLRERPGFDELIRDAVACREERFIIYESASASDHSDRRLIVYLHGLGAGPRIELRYWKQLADQTGNVIVAVKAPHRIAPMLYGWHNLDSRDSTSPQHFDLEAARPLIDAAVADAREKLGRESSPLILAGFSQGAGVALHLQRQQPERFQGVIALGSLCQSVGKEPWERSQKKSPYRIALIVGEEDRLIKRNSELAKELESARVPTQLQVITKVGHEYPANYEELFQEAFEYVVEPERDQ